jgi:hypothetical protein
LATLRASSSDWLGLAGLGWAAVRRAIRTEFACEAPSWKRPGSTEREKSHLLSDNAIPIATIRDHTLRLMLLLSHARLTPDRPALEVVPQEWVDVVSATRHRGRRYTPSTMTVPEFSRSLAKLGGFPGRKRDGEPGWITIWRGFGKLQLILRGVEFARTGCR